MASTAYSGGGTNTHIALQYAGQTSFTSGNGMRSNAAQIAFVITDGRSGSSSATKTEAAMLREKVRGVILITIVLVKSNPVIFAARVGFVCLELSYIICSKRKCVCLGLFCGIGSKKSFVC